MICSACPGCFDCIRRGRGRGASTIDRGRFATALDDLCKMLIRALTR